MARKLVIRQPISNQLKLILKITSILILILGYEFLTIRQHRINPTDRTIPTFFQMGEALYKVCTPDHVGKIWLFQDFKATMIRHLTGLGLGVIISVIVGVLMGCFKIIEHFCLPVLSFLTKVPPTAMLAVFFVVVGTDYKLFIALIGFGVFPILTQAIYQAAKYDVPEELINKSYTLGASNCEVIINVVTMMILPRIIEAIRLQVGPAMVYLIAAEWMMGDVGFGYRLRQQSRINMAVVYDYVIILGVIGVVFDKTLTWVRKICCPWFDVEK